jgi:hypothetical protein
MQLCVLPAYRHIVQASGASRLFSGPVLYLSHSAGVAPLPQSSSTNSIGVVVSIWRPLDLGGTAAHSGHGQQPRGHARHGGSHSN